MKSALQVYAMKVVDKASVERYHSMHNIAIELEVLRRLDSLSRTRDAS